ncbi:MAG: signal recognition particle-docking protein FtsY [Streptococcaceae bacterium]|jgi:fused signal recognition particle receptor|nr:signal recognition particle-docking protein FtsY [Streptococcaceae bacterium]
MGLFDRLFGKKVEEETSEENAASVKGTLESEADNNEIAPEPSAEAELVEQKYERTLEKTNKSFGERFNAFLANFRSVDEEFFEDLEETLILSDVGADLAMKISEKLRQEAKLQNIKSSDQLKALIIEELVNNLDEENLDKALNIQNDGLTVMIFVGVNGAGKTTSIGKLAARLKKEGKKVLLAAGDTFRAGATDQLLEWAKRSDLPVVTGREASDPASVVYDAMQRAKSENFDVLIIDTAGRLQNKDNLMAELAKMRRIIQRELPSAPHETLLVLDASTGQNAVSQAKEFSKVTPVTGIVLTKLDGSAKGGIVLSIIQTLKIPIKLVGLGEKIDDLAEFDEEFFVRGLFKGLI